MISSAASRSAPAGKGERQLILSLFQAIEGIAGRLQAEAVSPTGCATCTTFRHRHRRRSRLIETAKMKVTRREDKAGDQEEAERIQ